MNSPALNRDSEPWIEQDDALLGTDVDRVIAAKLRRSTIAVAMRRKKTWHRRLQEA